MPKIRIFIACMAILNLFFSIPAKAAFQPLDCAFVQGFIWLESATPHFSIQYTQSTSQLAQLFTSRRWNSLLESEYTRFEALFETTFNTPPTIRIYPDIETYTCLNSSAEDLASKPEKFIHTTSGSGEISLIGDHLIENFSAWAAQDLELLRYDLAILFTRQLAGDRTPPGMLTGLGHYAQDPDKTTALLKLNPSDWVEPRSDWRTLWENQPLEGDLAGRLETQSTVSFLIDRYGWTAFLQFLRDLPSVSGYRQALEKNYSTSLTELEDGWRAYYPGYFQGGWKHHAIYNPDLDRYLQLIRAENYGGAASELKETVAFLEKIQQTEKIQQAWSLYVMAQRGHEAEVEYAQAMQLFQSGNYAAFLDALAQAEANYAEAGNRFYHLDEFAAHRRQVEQIIALHAELDQLQARFSKEWNTFSLANQLLLIGNEFIRLGDTNGYQRTKLMLEAVEIRQRQQYIFLATLVFTVVLLLLGFLLYLSRRAPPLEAQL